MLREFRNGDDFNNDTNQEYGDNTEMDWEDEPGDQEPSDTEDILNTFHLMAR
jgi:hypothetical protein